jgi:radical SAM protein with 4Fe4S-binding SPASM domain
MDYIKNLKNNAIYGLSRYFVKKHIYNRYISRRFSVSSFPPEVWIENTNCCNAKCVMCPREKHNRPLGIMKFTLFEKLIKEISTFKNDVRRVHLHNYGEPLLDKKLPKRNKLAKDYGIKHVYFVTNASLLTPELSQALIETGLDEFKISFYGTDKKTYNDRMDGLDFDSTLQNIKDFFKIRKDMKALKPKVVIQYIPQTTNHSEIEKFSHIFNHMIDKNVGDSLHNFSLHNFGDGRDYYDSQMDKITSTCYYPWRTMVILHDGKVVICCLDYNGVLVVGDVNKNTIKEIWNNEQYRKVRDDFKHLRYSEYSICKKCNVIR